MARDSEQQEDEEHAPGPRELLEIPGLFGDRPDVQWDPNPDEWSREQYAAAMIQHLAALEVNLDNARRQRSVAALGRRIGVKGDVVRRKLNGERWATVLDLATWAYHSTPRAVPSPDEIDAVMLHVRGSGLVERRELKKRQGDQQARARKQPRKRATGRGR